MGVGWSGVEWVIDKSGTHRSPIEFKNSLFLHSLYADVFINQTNIPFNTKVNLQRLYSSVSIVDPSFLPCASPHHGNEHTKRQS